MAHILSDFSSRPRISGSTGQNFDLETGSSQLCAKIETFFSWVFFIRNSSVNIISGWEYYTLYIFWNVYLNMFATELITAYHISATVFNFNIIYYPPIRKIKFGNYLRVFHIELFWSADCKLFKNEKRMQNMTCCRQPTVGSKV